MKENREERKQQGEEAKGDHKDPKNESSIKNHTSQGHSTGAQGSATSSKEPTLRSATTDSSRVPKNRHDDLPTGGNIR